LDKGSKGKDPEMNYDFVYAQYSNRYKEKYDDSNINNSNQKNRKYKGGSVLSPKQGLHYDVHVFDVTSLYPTIIINYNISPETINCSCCKSNIKTRSVFDRNYLKDCRYIPKNNNGYWICQQRKGLFSKILQDLTDVRIKYKKEGKEIESFAIKSIINSGYGVFGYPNFKYYDPKIAEIITVLGRQILSEMQKIANELDLAILYGDTDSLFVNNIKRKEDIYKFIDECKRKLNIDVSHEKIFRKLILVSKKHYIGIQCDPDKEPIIKGMEGIKSDRPKFIQEVFKEMINDIKKDINPIPKLKQSISELECRRVPADKLAISLVLNKNPEEYTNDCLQKRLGIKKGLQKGDSFVYYKCDKEEAENNFSEKTNIKNINESDDPKDISYAKYKEMFINSAKDVIEILGYNVERDLTYKKKLTGIYLSIVTTN
jgi:DNA polymerase, archaea type